MASRNEPDDRSRRRLRLLGLLGLAAVLVLVAKLALIQVVSAPGYREIASGNRIRVIQTPAPRGRILDVNGRILAGNRSTYVITLDWEPLAELSETDRAEVFGAAVDELHLVGHDELDEQALDRRYRWARRQVLEPLVLVDDVGADAWIALSERGLPGFEVAVRPVRTYPYGTSAAHVLGYLGTVGDEEEAVDLNRSAPDSRYRSGSEIGRAGLERIFERHLRGVPEIRRVEIDSRNRVVRTVEVVQRARPGHDLHLTIDVELQRAAESELAARIRALGREGEHPAEHGSFVVIDPSGGAVLAMASHPSFDPASFVGGLDEAAADELFSDPRRPLLNRATNGLYAPGSTFKPVPAYAALASGLRGEHERWNDEGRYRLANCRSDAGKGCVFRNAKGVVMGSIDLRGALTRSSDTYFYSLGERFWLQRETYGDEPMQAAAERFGLGRPAGIELPREAAGRVPGPSQRLSDHVNHPDAFPESRWFTGDNVNLSIGQGDLLVTPLQLANLYATLAADGRRFQPRLIDRITDPESGDILARFEPRPVAEADLDPAAVAAITDGLAEVTTRGTGAEAFRGFDHDAFPLAAKTGTAEVAGHDDNALFAGFGPLSEPRYAFAVVLEEAGFGGVAAAPVARAFLDRVLAESEPALPVEERTFGGPQPGPAPGGVR